MSDLSDLHVRTLSKRPLVRVGQVGQLIASRYRVQALLGEGGMGAVFRVHDESEGRLLALKRLGLGMEADRLRFRREFHSLANLRHAGIVQVYEYGLDEQGPFYTMELVEGCDLSESTALPVPTVLRVLRDVAEILAFLHARRLLHRDLTPRNIRLDAQGRARLLDFGILATVGVPGEVAGTPPYVAPETLRHQPLDPRADLFSFGALAYWLLTRRHAYPARTMEELEEKWSHAPEPPSTHAREVQPELDALVLSLLSTDLLRRPRSAVEVVDRLDALLGESRRPQREAAEGYLSHTPLVGRQREMVLLEQLVARVTRPQGRGAVLLVEGEPGSGKSRMLREVALEAQVAGAVVVHARAEPGTPPYALVQALVRGLFAAAPAEAAATAGEFAPVLARLPELRERLRTPPAPALEDPAEERLRLLSTLASWLEAFCQRRPLALLVDDGHAADEPSLALLVRLASLAPQHRLVMALGCAAEARARAPEALAALRRASSRLCLQPLEEPEVEALLRGTFGEGTELKALARWLYRGAHGSPLHTLELLRHLVERGAVRYLDGMWLVGELSRVEAPSGLADAFSVRLERLSPRALALAEALAVHELALPLELCVAVGDGSDEVAVFSQLDELVRGEVLVGDGSTYRFRHTALREALLQRLTPERLRSLHRAMGHALRWLGLVGERKAETGWHLLRGGEEREGAELLEEVGRARFDVHDFADAMPPLEAAVEAYERLGLHPRAVLEMRFRLAYCGAISDHVVLHRHVPAAVEGLFDCAGLWRARRLRRYVGPTLALLAGLAIAGVRWLLTPPARRTVPPHKALVDALLVLACSATTANILNDVPALERSADLAETAAVWRNRIPYSVAIYLRNMVALARSNWQALERDAGHALHVLHTDRLTPITPQFVRITEGAMRVIQLLPMWLLRQEPRRFAEEQEAIERLKLQFSAGYRACFQAAFHRLRGEEQRALELDARAEVLILQLGAGWGLDVIRTRFCAVAYPLTHDVLGLKRAAEALARRVEEGAAYGELLGLVRGDYHRERGELEESEAALGGAMAKVAPGDEMLRQGVLAALSETHLARGQEARALELAREAVALGGLRQRRHALFAVRAERALALALEASGQVEAARRGLEEALAVCGEMDNPLLEGVLREALTRVAGQAGDAVAEREHRAAMERCYEATANPALLARMQSMQSVNGAARRTVDGGPEEPATLRLAEVPWKVGSVVIRGREAEPQTRRLEEAAPVRETTLVADVAGGHGRAARTLELLREEAGAEVGFLYLAQADRLELAAPTSGAEPPDEVAEACRRTFEDARQAQGTLEVPGCRRAALAHGAAMGGGARAARGAGRGGPGRGDAAVPGGADAAVRAAGAGAVALGGCRPG